jgi:hypothetical protein
MLRPTVSRNKSSICGLRPDFITVRQLSVCWRGALSLTRGRVCRLQLLLARVPWDSWQYFTVSDSRLPFSRLLRLAGLRWRYSTPPPHGILTILNWTLLYKHFTQTENTVSNSIHIAVCLPIRCLETGSSIAVCVFAAAGMCLQSRCLETDICSDCTIPAFRRHVTI